MKSTFRYTPLIIELMIIAVVIRLIGLVQPFVFQTLIDRVLPFQRAASLELILVILVGATVFSAMLGALSSLLGTLMANRLTSEMGGRIFDHALKLPLLRLQRRHVGEILARISEIDTVRAFLTGTVAGLIIDLLFVVIYVGALLILSPFLTMIVLIILPMQMLIFGIIGPFLRARLQESFKAGAAHQSRLIEAFGSPVTVKSLAAENLQRDRISATLNESLHVGWRVTKLNVVNDVVSEVLGGLSVILIIYFGAQLVFAGELTLGELIAFHLIAQKIAGPILSLSTVWEQWQGLRIARLRLGDLLNPAAENEPARPLLLPMSKVRIATENLSFGYSESSTAISDLTVAFPGGETSVVIGDSGCGKSTLAKLLCGLYQPSQGKVMFANNDISDYDPTSVRRHIGYVEQEPVLYAGTIAENLLMAKHDATQAEIDAALRSSSSDRFVASLAEGLKTQVGERGSHLSGGQRQRIALARSLLTEPDVLVLDEPTSSLDEESAQSVMEALKDLAGERTIIILTHRPDLVTDAKQIIDLNVLLAPDGELTKA